MNIGLDPDDYESEEKSDKSKSPNSIQSGKWQLGFQGDFKFFTFAAHLISFIAFVHFNEISILISSPCLAMSFDLYAKYGHNRTLSLVSPKKPYYQWRLRVPSGHVVRLVILTLQGAAPGSCTAHKLSAYDFLLPLQNKIIAR